jgi:transcriptional regulator with XRE-family HTH domain
MTVSLTRRRRVLARPSHNSSPSVPFEAAHVSLGRAVSAGREKHGLDRGALARYAQVEERKLEQIECGEVSPTFETLLKLANTLGEPLWVLMMRFENEEYVLEGEAPHALG